MKLQLIICILTATAALAQSTNQPPSLKTPAERGNSQAPTLQTRDQQSVIPADQPVITIQGLCPAVTSPAKNAAVPSPKECVTKITKEQFGNLVKPFNPNNQPVSEAERRKLAESYVDILIFSEAGKSAGLDNTPAFQELMRVWRLKMLADLYLNQLADQYRKPSQEEIEAYYQANQEKYETVKLGRIYIPKNDPDPQASLELKQAYPQRATQIADDMQARAAKGEPADKLQKEAYTSLGVTGNPPNTEMNVPRRGTLPPKLDQQVFASKVGDVFRLDDTNGYVIYHVDKREVAPLESVKKEIPQELLRSKVDEKMKELKAPVHASYDEKYFGSQTPVNAPVPASQPPASSK